jgi:diguanylate cyclase (GGDEF)-like protein
MASAGGRPPVPIRLEIVDLLDDPVMRAVAVTGHDITELHEARGRLEHMAGHDALTDLPNRSLLARHLSTLLADRTPLALLYVDLDRFKPVNDRFGHGAGDLVLRCVAERLVASVSASDIVSRIGGDEFVILAVGITDPEVAVALAERIRARIEEPFDLGAATVTVGASIGVALAGPGATPDELLHEADGAMYSAKAPRSAACDRG